MRPLTLAVRFVIIKWSEKVKYQPENEMVFMTMFCYTMLSRRSAGGKMKHMELTAPRMADFAVRNLQFFEQYYFHDGSEVNFLTKPRVHHGLLYLKACTIARNSEYPHLTFEDASRAIVDYIELYYNSERLHSGIGYYIPNQFLTLLSVH